MGRDKGRGDKDPYGAPAVSHLALGQANDDMRGLLLRYEEIIRALQSHFIPAHALLPLQVLGELEKARLMIDDIELPEDRVRMRTAWAKIATDIYKVFERKDTNLLNQACERAWERYVWRGGEYPPRRDSPIYYQMEQEEISKLRKQQRRLWAAYAAAEYGVDSGFANDDDPDAWEDWDEEDWDDDEDRDKAAVGDGPA